MLKSPNQSATKYNYNITSDRTTATEDCAALAANNNQARVNIFVSVLQTEPAV